MLKKYPLQQWGLLLAATAAVLLVLGLVLIKKPVLQISGYQGTEMSKGITTMVDITLKFEKIEKDILKKEGYVLVYLNNIDDQLQAKQALEQDLGSNYIVADSLTPYWRKMLDAL